MINSNEISVIVQGAIDKTETPKCLKSIRKYLPDAEIILSTWEGSDLNGLDYDVLVINQLPSAPIIEKYKHKIASYHSAKELKSRFDSLYKFKISNLFLFSKTDNILQKLGNILSSNETTLFGNFIKHLTILYKKRYYCFIRFLTISRNFRFNPTY